MSQNDMQNEPMLVEKPKNHLPTWLAIMIILALAISAGALIYLWAVNPAVKFNPQNELKQEDKLPATINSYVGKITAVGDKQITVKAEAAKNYLKEDVELTVKIGDNTILTALIIPKKITDPFKPLNLTKENIKFADLKVGQDAVIYSAENIKNKTEILASSVEVQSVK